MEILSKIQNFVGRKSPEREPALAENAGPAKPATNKSPSRYFVLQAMSAAKNLEGAGGSYLCASPEFECYFKKEYMPLFEEKRAYINVAFDQNNDVTHVCGLLPRLQNEKDRGKIEDEKMTLAKMPNCLLSQAIAEISQGQGKIGPLGGNDAHLGQAGSNRQDNSNIVFDPSYSDSSLKGAEKEWLESMQAALVDSEYKILMHLLKHFVMTRGFREKIDHFLHTRTELEPGNFSVVITSFQYLSREFQFEGKTITVAQIGTALEQAQNLKPKEIFSVIVELFFCLGYDKEIQGYTTGFTDLI